MIQFPLQPPLEGKKNGPMSYQFQRWIIILGAQVRALHESVSSKNSEKLKSELKTYEAELQHLYAYAEQRNIDLIKYYHPFAEIEERLLLIHEHLASRQAGTK